jgi:predicted ABC-type ATPase
MKSDEIPRIVVFAGPNGSGKSALASAWEPAGLHINADDIKTKRGCSDLDAAREAERLRELCLSERRSFAFETVLSTERNLNLLARAKAAATVCRLTKSGADTKNHSQIFQNCLC